MTCPLACEITIRQAQVPFPVDVRTIVFCVADNGKKFIFAEPVDRNESLNLVLNWTAALKR